MPKGGGFHDPSQYTRHKTDEPTARLPVCQSARPTRAVIAEAWMGLRTDVRLSAKFARSQSGGQDRVRVAMHGTELERGGGELGNDHWTHQHQRSQGVKDSSGEWSAREPSAAGAGRVSTASVLHGSPSWLLSRGSDGTKMRKKKRSGWTGN